MYFKVLLFIMSAPGISIYNFKIPDNKPPFVYEPPIRNSLMDNIVVRDIDSRLHTTLGFGDSITYAHEGTHELNSLYRNKYSQRFPRCNALYELNGNVIIIYNPTHVTLRYVADCIPTTIRGRRYDLYLKQQQKYWNNEPTYLLDEWVAYLNGLEAGLHDNRLDKINIQADCEASVELFGYVCVFCMVSYDKYMNGNEWRIMQNTVFWNTRRMLKLIYDCKQKNIQCDDALQLLDKFRTSLGTFQLRIFTSAMLGKQWCKDNLGF